jgi:MFS family permease
MDVSSESIHSLLPVFLVSVLGASVTTVGVIEGIGEASASIVKLGSGWLSDKLGRRKPLTIIGYGLGGLSKPLFALATSPGWVLGARFSDRVGKGIRGAPRDALLTDLTPPGMRGAAFGLRQSLDTIGAFVGPLLAILLMAASNDNFRLVFWLATIPAVLAVLVLIFGVHEPADAAATRDSRPPFRFAEVLHFPAFFWAIVGVATVLTLARFSEAFLILRAQGTGLPAALVPLVLVVLNVVYGAAAYPVGVLSDRLGRWALLPIGFATLITADVLLAFAPNLWISMLGIAFWGLHLGLTQGLLSALVADSAPVGYRGTGFGVFHLASGVAVLLASLIAGVLWDRIGAQATFLAGAGFTLVGLVGWSLLPRHAVPPRPSPRP